MGDTVYYQTARHTYHLGGALAVLRTLPPASVDACATDPPYELGFMGKAWDRSGIAYSVALWQEVRRVLKPGGHLVAFGGTRTYHRLTCAIEDAGFEIRRVQENPSYRFISDNAQAASRKYGVKTISLVAVRR